MLGTVFLFPLDRCFFVSCSRVDTENDHAETNEQTQHKEYKSRKQRKRKKRIPCLVESYSQPTSIHTQ
jgi:hypothetical protein